MAAEGLGSRPAGLARSVAGALSSIQPSGAKALAAESSASHFCTDGSMVEHDHALLHACNSS